MPFGSLDWRFRSLDVLGLSDGIISKLAEHDIHTLGELSDFWSSGELLSNYRGFGSEKSATVADAWADYGKDNPEVFGLQGTEDEAGGASSDDAADDDPGEAT